MNRKSYIYLTGILTLFLFLSAIISETIYFGNFEYRFRTRRFNRILVEKERIMEQCLNEMKPILAMEDHHGSMTENDIFTLAEQNKITILEYLDNKLNYWSDNDFEVPPFINDTIFDRNLIFFQNGWFLPKVIKAGSEKIVGLLRIRTEYSFENNIIKSGFEEYYGVPENVSLSTDSSASVYHVSDINGKFLFSLVYPEVKVKTSFIYLPLILWTLTFILLLLLISALGNRIARGGKGLAATAFMFLAFSVIYISVLVSGKPQILSQTELFSPYRFSLNFIIPSLGHLLLLSILAAGFANFFQRHAPPGELKVRKAGEEFLISFLLFLPGIFLFGIFHFLFTRLVSTSNINFETYKLFEIDFFSISGFTAIILLVLVPVLYLSKVFTATRLFRPAIVYATASLSLLLLLSVFHSSRGELVCMAGFFITVILFVNGATKSKIGLFNLSVILSVIIGAYVLYFITILSEEKTDENLKVRAVSLSAENDPDAEQLILDQWPALSKDPILGAMMQIEYFDNEDVLRIKRYLQDNYFTGYWSNFNFNVVLCRNDESLNVGPANEITENCFRFFNDRIRMNGHRITGTQFFFIDNQGGRSFYLGRLFYLTGKNVTNGLFIELYSDINVFQPGYSELLLDKKYHAYMGMKDYSFAKYINGELVLSTGEFSFDKNDEEYIDKVVDYRLFSSGGYNHVLYRNGNSTIIITRPELTVGDIVISFAYIFVYVLVFSNLFILLLRRPAIRPPVMLNFRQKLQLSFIGILLFSFLLIGVVVAYITISQFHSKHYDTIREKLNSVYLELDTRLSSDRQIAADLTNNNYTSLNELLIRLSNTFNTDINLYDLNGFLITTSRPEIFFRNLTSRRINNMAFINLASLTRSEYIQTEKIGSLEYISAYVPYIDSDKRVIAYLNLPYFRMQSVLAREISNLIVAIVNFALLLIVITMSMAVFISGRLTTPLKMLGEGLESVGVGKKTEHLVYGGSDEIGELVRQYNRMVDEIDESAQKLANSEREYAWREMAKQIAHEIKNPLTPMKLNVQQLFKSWNDKAPQFDKLLERFTRNQIEYIDNLSSIATAFSSFAKMPGNNPMELNLLDQIRSTLELFKNADNIRFITAWPEKPKVLVYADKEHLNSVFDNLIKNGIQSIPPGREGEITVSIEIRDKFVITSIKDNGTGVPDDLRKKLFTPNFTTKSSGMGLGLSIAKRYIENAGGRIWFESEPGNGSIFFVELPLTAF